MKCNFIQVKLRDKSNINLNNNKIFELLKLSFGNNIINLNYNKNKKESSNKNLIINYYKTYFKKNIGKMVYTNVEGNEEIKIFNEEFISNNIKRAKIFINNKLYNLKEDLENKKQLIKIKIKFLDNIFYLNSMFEDCISLSSVYHFEHLNTKYLKTINDLFSGCSLLLSIDGLSNWVIDNINNIERIFYQCSSLESLPDISKWNTKNLNYIQELFYECSSLKELPDISKWDLSNVNNISGMFDGCSSLEELPDKVECKRSYKYVFFISRMF